MAKTSIKVKTYDKDKGWINIQKNILELDGKKLNAGLLKGSKNSDGANLPDIGFFNEFGTKKMPERPWMRSYVDGKSGKGAGTINHTIGFQLWRLMDGKLNVTAFLNRVGIFVVAGLKNSITNLRKPENAISTIKAKGSSNPLIDTGQMRASIDFEVAD